MSTQKHIYAVGCHTPEDWDYIHEILLQDQSTENFVPCNCIECPDLKEHSSTRALYLLTDEEAEELKNHAKVKFVHLDIPSNPDVFKKPHAKDLYNAFRYTTNVKNYRSLVDDDISLLPETPTIEDMNRCGYQLMRSTQRTNPWNGETGVLPSKVPYTLDGKHVDLVVADDGCWHGHPEFQNNTGYGPTNYVGGNVLPGNGTCDVLDLILDSPYYIDPAWFNADPAARLMTRWDGTTVPTESAAHAWWSSGANRSATFANIGTVPVSSNYTRAAHCGSNIKPPPINGTHGTPCASQAFGRTLGWAFNANKWTISAIANANGIAVDNANDIEYYFDILKLFHMYKPINPIYGNKNPTVSSNSWGYSSSGYRASGTKYYFYRKGASGGKGAAYTSTTLPGFLNNFTAGLGQEMVPNAATAAGDEVIAAGVIFVTAAGNTNQKQVNSNHKDYNNYWGTSSTATLANSTSTQFDLSTYNTINRRGFPEHIGKTANGQYPAITVGALDDDYHSSGKEQKVFYSNMGNTIDVYAPADGTLGANLNYDSIGVRPDTYPSISGKFFGRGVTGVATSTAYMGSSSEGGGQLFGGDTESPNGILLNSGRRITTTSNDTVSVTSITYSAPTTAGLTADSTPSIGMTFSGYDYYNYNGFWDVVLPFNINFGSLQTDEVFINTNSYVTFGSRPTNQNYDWDIYNQYTQSEPPMPKMFILSSDGTGQKIWTGVFGTAPNRTYKIRFEGTSGYGFATDTSTIIWELTFYEASPYQIDLQTAINSHISKPTDCSFGGTSSACPVTAGLIATVLQENRTWNWKKVRKYITGSMRPQSKNDFYIGKECTKPNDPAWSDKNSIQGSTPIILYNRKTS